MNAHADKSQENNSHAVAHRSSNLHSDAESTFQFVDKRPEAIGLGELQNAMNDSPRVRHLSAYQQMADNGPQVKQLRETQALATNMPVQRQDLEEEMLQGDLEPIQKKSNNTGLPNNLKAGIENLSGMSMDNVQVHYNSTQPAQLNALAYAQGSDIHVASGQEKHLPHEAWHVVQQAQGRVQATKQMKTGVPVNDDPALEHEADVMGAKALENNYVYKEKELDKSVSSNTLQRKIKINDVALSDNELVEKKQTDGQSMPGENFDRLFMMQSAKEDFKFKDWDEAKQYVNKLESKIWKELTDADVPDEMKEIALKQTLSRRLGQQENYNKSFADEYQKDDKLKGNLDAHLEQFIKSGGHAFIPDWIFQKQTAQKDPWGWANPVTGNNFITTKAMADALVVKATNESGVATLESELGVKTGQWSNKGEINYIYRFHLPPASIQKLNLRMATGKEGGAYQQEWLGGMKTLKGVGEAVVDGWKENSDLKQNVSNGTLIITKLTFGPNNSCKEENISL